MEVVLYMWGITGEEYYAAQSQMRFPLLYMVLEAQQVRPPVNPAVVHPTLCATRHRGTDITSDITPSRSCKTGSCQGPAREP